MNIHKYIIIKLYKDLPRKKNPVKEYTEKIYKKT